MNELDLARLKEKMRRVMARLGAEGTHATLPDVLEKLGLREAPKEGAPSKNDRMMAVFGQVSDEQLPVLAQRYLDLFNPRPDERNEIQELLWKDAPGPKVPERYRREVARSLSREDLRARGMMDLLERLWVLDGDGLDFLFPDRRSLRQQLQQHVFNNTDLDPEDVFDLLGAFECTDARFVAFIEGLASHRVRPDVEEQQRIVKVMKETLGGCGVELVHVDDQGGYPRYRMVSKDAGNRGRPKQVIFAPLDGKPDLRLCDAVNGDIEVVSDQSKILIYDGPIAIEGLRWRDLQAWWAERERVPNDQEAKKSLYRRLAKSLPEDSPPQKLLFDTFFTTFRTAFEDLPALLPEVWLHYDPKTVEQRGVAALLRQRMDFLLLFSHQRRVVIEVDGRQHYSDEQTGAADTRKYARTMAADRELRLRGYEVYHFGGAELQGDAGKELVADFFCRLFARHDVTVST